MRRNIADVVEVALVEVAQNLYKLGKEAIGKAFARKDHALRIPPCRGYFPREEDAEIREKLKNLCQSRNSSSVKTLVLHGPRGHGRQYSAANVMSQLYTSRISNSFLLRSEQRKQRFLLEKSTIKWTVNATNARTLLESYCSLAKEIGLTEEAKIANQLLSLHSRTSEGRQIHMYLHDHCHTDAYDEALKQIYEGVMKKLRDQDSWVLLIDGPAENVAALENVLPQPGDRRFGNGLVIMTTKDPSLLIKGGRDSCLEKVYIGKMTNSDAVKFLESKSGIVATGSDKMYAEDIAVKMLKCIPQDIADFASFVKEYKEDTQKELTFKEVAGTETSTPSECMMLLEMNRKNQSRLLYFLTCCSREDYLPLQILESCFSEATEAVRHSRIVEISERDGMIVVTMHARYHDTLREMLSRQETAPCEERCTGFYMHLISQFGSNRNKTNRINLPTLSPHHVSEVIGCLASICKTALQRSSDEDFTMRRFILPHLKESVQLGKEMNVKDVEPLVMADGHACLGETLLFFGESEEARNNLEIALAQYKGYEGPANVQLDVANVLHFLGEAYGNSYLGDPKKGERHLSQALEEKERFYHGKANPQVAFTLRSLGNVLNELGKHTEAIKRIKRALEMYDDWVNNTSLKQEYGYTLSELGSSYRYLGRYIEAEDYLKKALKIFRSVDSPSKLRMGVTLSRLASVQRNMDKLDESIATLDEAQNMFGYNDLYTAVILSKLSVVYRYKGDSTRSLHFAEKASEITDKQRGSKEHPAIATALLNLGHAQSDVWNVEDAEKNLTKALKIYEALHGENHRIVAATLNYLGYAYEQSGKVQQGKEMLEKAVGIMDKNYPPSHPEKANSLKRLSKACLILGETVKSAELANHALQIYKKTYENTMGNRDVRKVAVRVAYACCKIGLFQKAKEYLKEVELGFPNEKIHHPEFAAFLQKKTEIVLDSLEINWPLDEESIQKITSAAKFDLLKAEEILKRSLGCNSQQYALIKKEQARLNIIMGNYESAYKEIRTALDEIVNICLRRPESGHHLKAEFSLVRGDAEGKLELMSGQKESLTTAESIYRNCFGDNHPMVASTLQKLCVRYLEVKNLKEASKYLEESGNICAVLKRGLQEQLASCNSDFLIKYNLDAHPILKRQLHLEKKIRPPQGAWQ